jgi:hypothetical protein
MSKDELEIIVRKAVNACLKFQHSLRENEAYAEAVRTIKAHTQAEVERELEKPEQLLKDDLEKFEELWQIWNVEYGIDFNMEAIEQYFEKKGE